MELQSQCQSICICFDCFYPRSRLTAPFDPWTKIGFNDVHDGVHDTIYVHYIVPFQHTIHGFCERFVLFFPDYRLFSSLQRTYNLRHDLFDNSYFRQTYEFSRTPTFGTLHSQQPTSTLHLIPILQYFLPSSASPLNKPLARDHIGGAAF